MATILINRSEYTIPEGEKLNAIQMAKRVGIEIPYYCWHPALSVVANCRMCEIEVGTKDAKTGEIKMLPKLVPGCQTPAKDLTVLVTDSPKVKEHQRMVMEYLLLNHPLDCPVCDQAGECGLQDYSYHYGQATHRFVEERIVNPRKDVSDLIQLNQDRCIMCTRCVRFTREISQTGELEVMRRGNHAEIDIFPGQPVNNPLAGNVVDLCPVGALLDKDFLHKQRVWFLSKHDSVCTRCSTGCNISAEENRGALWRFKPRQNPHVNDYWICDEGRYSYKAANDPNLLSAMYVQRDGDHHAVAADEALKAVERGFQEIAQQRWGRRRSALAVPDRRGSLPAGPLPQGPEPGQRAGDGTDPDAGERSDLPARPDQGPDRRHQLRRPATVHHPCREMPQPSRRRGDPGPFRGQGDPLRGAGSARVGGRIPGPVCRVGLHRALDRRDRRARALRSGVKFLVVQDTNVTPLAHRADVVLAGATFAEKAGCYVNADGRLQYSAAALPPRDGSLPDLDLFAILLNRPGGPVGSSEVLAELAESRARLRRRQGR